MEENYNICLNDNKKLISSLTKDLNEYKRLYQLKDGECQKLIEQNRKTGIEELKKKNEKISLPPFKFEKIKVIENKKENENTNKLSLYKSLLDESRHKIEIYELYLKKMGIDKDQLIKAFGYDGVMTSSTKIANKDEINNNEDNKIINTIIIIWQVLNPM